MFITFEGIDRSGKSTQAKMLNDYLVRSGIKTILIREPGGTKVSERIREILLDKNCKPMDFLTEFFLFSASRRQLTEEIILPNLKKGIIVICDRYYDSSTSYQGYGGKVDIKIINTINKISTGGLIPDLTFLIDISFSESVKRKKAMSGIDDRIEGRKKTYYDKVVNGYREISKKNKRVILIDGKMPIEEIHKKIKSLLNNKLKSLK